MPSPDNTTLTESLLNEIPFSKQLLSRLGLQVAQITRQLQVDQVNIKEGNLQDVDIDKVNLGSATIGHIELEKVDASLKSSKAYLRNVRTIVELDFYLDWKIDLGWIGEWDGSEHLGDIDIPIALGDINIPDLSDIQLDIPSIDVPGVVAEMAPITSLSLGETALKNMQVSNTQLPSPGFSLSGMGVGSMTTTGISVPATETAKATVQSVTPKENIVLPSATLKNLSIPATRVSNIESSSFETTAAASSRSISADLGILDVTLRVVPTVHLDVGSMTLQDVDLAMTAKNLDLKNISIPVSLQGITVSSIGLENVTIDKVSV